MNRNHFQDAQEIRQVMLKYLEGSNRGDSSILSPYFHKAAVIYWDGAEPDVHTHAIQWFFDAIDKMGPDDDKNAPYTIDILDMTDGIAVVKVVEVWKGMTYTDYHSLIRTPDGWRIVAKLFHNHSSDR